MKTFYQSNITFTKYREASDGQAVGVAPIVVSDQEGVDPNFGGIVNAVDIDWNGGQLTKGDGSSSSTRTINNTGDLLDVINKQQEQIYILASAIIALQNQIS